MKAKEACEKSVVTSEEATLVETIYISKSHGQYLARLAKSVGVTVSEVASDLLTAQLMAIFDQKGQTVNTLQTMRTRLARLLLLVEHATPGPWIVVDDNYVGTSDGDPLIECGIDALIPEQCKRDAAYIATFNPLLVQRLLELWATALTARDFDPNLLPGEVKDALTALDQIATG